MTAKELIEKLQKLDPDTEIMIGVAENNYFSHRTFDFGVTYDGEICNCYDEECYI